MLNNNIIYFDNASTTKLNEEVLSGYYNLLSKYYVNSESLYDQGTQINQLVEKSRSNIASLFKCLPLEVIFQSCGSEANSLAIKGYCLNYLGQNKHIITSKIEHSSVLNACRQLEKNFGFKVDYLDVDRNGVIDIKQLQKLLNQDTILVSIMAVNNELGSINPIQEIKEICRRHGTCLHIDFVQALGKIEIDLKDIDLATFSMHKIHGLKGSAILIKKQHIDLLPLINGGQQEFGIRGGTNNAIVNIMAAKTIRLALENMKKNQDKIIELTRYCIEKLCSIDCIIMNSPIDTQVGIINFSNKQLYSEVMMNALNSYGICVSAQSTCHSKNKTGSYVLKAIGVDDKLAKTSIRISLDANNTISEIDYFIEKLKEIFNKYGTKL